MWHVGYFIRINLHLNKINYIFQIKDAHKIDVSKQIYGKNFKRTLLQTARACYLLMDYMTEFVHREHI